MSEDRIHAATAEAIYAAIAETPKKSKQVLLKTLLRQYGFKTRQKHHLETVHETLREAGVIVAPDLRLAERDDWIRLSVGEPQLPVGDFIGANRAAASHELVADDDDWLDTIATKPFASEKEVEIRFVVPLLERLGYSEDDRADGHPVHQVVGVRKIRTEADFVLFDGRNRGKDAALLVVEAKMLGKKLADYVQQAKSYAMFLGTPYFLVTNGDEIRVFLYRNPIEAEIEVYRAHRRDLRDSFSVLYNLISKRAVVAYKRRKKGRG